MDWTTQLDNWMKNNGLRYDCDEPMSRHTFFRIGGPARRMAYPDSEAQLAALLEAAEGFGIEPLVIGNGSNLLVADAGLDRLVIDTSAAMNEMEEGEEGRISAGAGVVLARLADYACRLSLTGLEFAHGIPGTLGGAVCMNAGAYGGEMSHVLESARVYIPGEGVKTLSLPELKLGYRESIFIDNPRLVVLGATVRLQKGDPESIREQMRDLMARRKASQPLEYPSAGSTFKRPAGHFAGALIEGSGLKGFTVGGAQVSEKHAGFVINLGGATCADVTELIRRVQEIVFEKTGVRLEPEVRIIG